MTPYRYVKSSPLLPVAVKSSQTASGRRFSFLNLKIISLLMITVGVFFLANAVYPIVFYQLFVSPRFATSFVSPSSEAAIAQTFSSSTKTESPPSFVDSGVLGQEIDLLDLTKANNWFPKSKTEFRVGEIFAYTLTIPKLTIYDAQVVVAGEDLKKSLIQFPGTAVPGRFGNTVIFGHSVLPQFFNPANYITIFSTLPSLRVKDEILVDYNNVRYRYLVEQMIEVLPDDVSILAQRYDDSYLTLITCIPPGTYLKRLIVRARIAKS